MAAVTEALAFQAAASFVVAGGWIASATLLTERLGPRLGGLLGNLPSNILVSFLFVALAHGPEFTARATLSVPSGMTIDALFVLAFALLVPVGLGVAVLGSLVLWVGLAFVAAEVRHEEPLGSIALFLAVTAVAFLALHRRARVVEPVRRSYGPGEVAARALFAGTVVGSTVLLSGLVGTYWTGLFGTFPAVLLTTLVILAKRQGAEFARGTGKILVLGSTNIVVFSLVVRATFPAAGPWIGSAAALGAAVLWILALRPFVRRLA